MTGARAAYLHVGKVHPVEVGQHLVDLGGVLQHGSSCLGQVVQRRVPAQGLRKRRHYRHLWVAGGKSVRTESQCFSATDGSYFQIHKTTAAEED